MENFDSKQNKHLDATLDICETKKVETRLMITKLTKLERRREELSMEIKQYKKYIKKSTLHSISNFVIELEQLENEHSNNSVLIDN